MKEYFIAEKIVLEYEVFPAKGEGEARLPLLVWLSGEEDVQDENAKAVSFFKKECCLKKLHFLVLNWNALFPFRGLDVCKAIQRLVFDVRKRWHMDVCRTYLAGYSEGAAGVWQLLAGYPRMFAAGVAIAGYGDPYRVRNAREVPVWAFHAADDDQIPPSGSICENEGNLMVGSARLVCGLRNVGAAQSVKYTEFVRGGHKIVEKALSAEVTDWLCEQNRKRIFRVESVGSGVWRIDDYFMSSCYLIEGKEKALLIDTGLGEGDFGKLIRRLTDRPVSLAVTHLHPDHMYHSHLFEEIYVHREAVSNFSGLYEKMLHMDLSAFDSLYGVKLPPQGKGRVRGLSDGDCIELDDTCRITAAFLTGHTEYDCVFVDDRHRLVFTGDAVGSGYTVGIPMAEAEMEKVLMNYRSSLDSFLKKYGKRVSTYGFMGGHFIQENGCDDTIQEDYLNGRSRFFVPLSLQVIEDMKILCSRIMEGKCLNERSGKEYSWAYASARISGTFLQNC